MTKAKGIDLEIVEDLNNANSNDLNVLVPTIVRINGQSVLLPEDATITISEISSKDIITATLTMIVGSLSVHAEHVKQPEVLHNGV